MGQNNQYYFKIHNVLDPSEVLEIVNFRRHLEVGWNSISGSADLSSMRNQKPR